MRTNIEIDDALMKKAMQAGPYQTKKEAVEAGLKLLARQVAYREILKWEGKLKWEGDESIDWTKPDPDAHKDSSTKPEPAKLSDVKPASRKTDPVALPATKGKRRAGR